MNSTKLRSLLTLLLVLLFSIDISSGQAVQLNNIIQQTFKEEGTQKEVTLPDPLNLNPEWWHYFAAANERELLEERIERFNQLLDERVDEYPLEEQRRYNSTIAHIKANLSAYEHLKFSSSPQPEPPAVVLEHYSLTQLMGVLHKERELNTQVKRIELDVKDQEGQHRTLSRQLDTAMLSFLESGRFAPSRFSDGLSIVLMQTEVALIEERLRLQRKSLEQQRNALAETEKHKDIAIKRLEFSLEERLELEERIVQAEEAIKEANSRLLREQAQVMVATSEQVEDQAVARYRGQRALRAKINLASAEIRHLIYSNERDSLILLSDDLEINATEIQGNIHARTRALQELQVKMSDWVNQNEVERTLSNQFLADAESKYGESDQLFLVEMARDRLNLVQEISVLLQKLQTDLLDAYFLINIIEKQLINHQGVFQNWGAKIRASLSNAWRSTKQTLNAALFKVGDTPVSAFNFAQFVVIVLVSWWIAFWLNKFLFKIGNRRGDEKLPVYYLIGRLIYYGIILFGFLFALTTIGIDFTNFALVAGALAIGLGFGLQSIVNNFVSGLILLFERSIKVGDFIELQDQQKGRSLWGEVKEINVRATIIRDNDNVDIVIPNSEFINTKMLNWTLKEPQRRMRYPFRVAYGTDKELVREAVLEAAEELPHTLRGIPGRNPAVWLTDFKEFYYEFELVVWLTARAVKRPNGVRASYLWAIDSALRKYGIEIPVPQREHRFREGESLSVKQEKIDSEYPVEECSDQQRQQDLFDDYQ